jgi:hypothetical protein
MLLLLLLLSVDLALPGTRLNTGDSFKSKTGVDNKRHANAHQPLTSHSPTGSTIPPLRHSLSPIRFYSYGYSQSIVLLHIDYVAAVKSATVFETVVPKGGGREIASGLPGHNRQSPDADHISS